MIDTQSVNYHTRTLVTPHTHTREMGLDIGCDECGHNVLHIGYSGFNALRNAIAKALGFDPLAIRRGDIKEDERCKKEKPALYEFFHHSDCDGTWTHSECERLLPMLMEAIPLLDAADGQRTTMMVKGKGKDDDKVIVTKSAVHTTFVERVNELIEGMEHAIAEEHTLEFH